MFRVIIFDFDGVILESLDIKTKAFQKVFHDYPEHAQEIARYHLQNGGVSRYKKFEYIHKNILRIPLRDGESDELGKRFSEAVINEMLMCPFVKGALEFLEKYSRIVTLYIASGTPEEELRYIVEERGLSKYFKAVCGTPASKTDIILNIINKEKIKNVDAVFIGDAMTDYEAARASNVQFIARMNDQTPDNPFRVMNLTSVNDLYELDNILERGFEN